MKGQGKYFFKKRNSQLENVLMCSIYFFCVVLFFSEIFAFLRENQKPHPLFPPLHSPHNAVAIIFLPFPPFSFPSLPSTNQRTNDTELSDIEKKRRRGRWNASVRRGDEFRRFPRRWFSRMVRIRWIRKKGRNSSFEIGKQVWVNRHAWQGAEFFPFWGKLSFSFRCTCVRSTLLFSRILRQLIRRREGERKNREVESVSPLTRAVSQVLISFFYEKSYKNVQFFPDVSFSSKKINWGIRGKCQRDNDRGKSVSGSGNCCQLPGSSCLEWRQQKQSRSLIFGVGVIVDKGTGIKRSLSLSLSLCRTAHTHKRTNESQGYTFSSSSSPPPHTGFWFFFLFWIF